MLVSLLVSLLSTWRKTPIVVFLCVLAGLSKHFNNIYALWPYFQMCSLNRRMGSSLSSTVYPSKENRVRGDLRLMAETDLSMFSSLRMSPMLRCIRQFKLQRTSRHISFSGTAKNTLQLDLKMLIIYVLSNTPTHVLLWFVAVSEGRLSKELLRQHKCVFYKTDG